MNKATSPTRVDHCAQKTSQISSAVKICIGQFCDNMGSVGVVAKGLATKPPLAQALMCISLACLETTCELSLTHLAGERNDIAEAVSRLNFPGPQNRIELSPNELWQWWSKILDHGLQ